QQKLAGESIERESWTELGLPNILQELTADGLLAVLHAFGACAAPFSRTAPSVSTRSMSTCEWTQIGARACSRLQLKRGRPWDDWRDLAPVVSHSLLG